MINLGYQKRKNNDLFKSLENKNSLFLSNCQNYIPIYSRFFSLNETNYNNINLNHKWYISNTNKKNEFNENLFSCRVKNINNNKIKDKEVFFKLAPLLDPYKFLIGKYNVTDPNLLNLPDILSDSSNTNPKILDVNNSAYVDGFFLFLSSNLIHKHDFIHGVDYYGSFLAIKNNFPINIYDDIDYLNNSEFFNKNKNILFTVDNYEHLFQENDKKKPIVIEQNDIINEKHNISAKSFKSDIFEDIFDTEEKNDTQDGAFLCDLIDITNVDMLNIETRNVSLKTNSSCSSRSSYTDDNVEDNMANSIEDNDINDSLGGSDKNNQGSVEDSDTEEEEEIINAIIPKFPVQVIGMENCENTFDELILTEDLSPEEWYSALMQIIMILITYQKAFHFTHNDLHTNNIMYNETDRKFIYYCYKKKYYKVPTFGRIFKIIDFGRSIYRFKGDLFCSDSFKNGGDAATQYNTEPYFNDKKHRLDPNYSFDLCRLACSIFDYLVGDMNEIQDLTQVKDPIKRLIVEWCLDDKGINMLYKNNGADRYPDFKLYKMIARCVHNHTPQAQLERPEFNAFSNFKGEIPTDVINIDNIPSYA
jgi:hypothetical protein